MHLRQTILILILLAAGFSARAQLYSNDFENQYTWYPPWLNLRIVADSTALEGQFVCVCDSTMGYGLGIAIEAGKQHPRQNINIQYEFLFKTETAAPHAVIAFSIDDETGNKYWNSYSLAQFVDDTAVWSRMYLNLNFPADYIGHGKISTFIWNREKENLWFDNAAITITPWTMPSFLPEIQHDSITEDSFVLRMEDSLQTPLTYPIGMLTEYILDGDTVSEFHLFYEEENLFVSASSIDTTHIVILKRDNRLILIPVSSFYKKCHLLRQALVIPFIDSILTVYRRNMAVDTLLFQSEYYLDREGFQVGEGERSTISYHQMGISSTQFDAANRVAYFNLDYWRDHPMIHYPLSDTLDHFEDISTRPVYDEMQWDHFITLYFGDDVPNLPRIMPIPNGYESGIIFTEHADWTDLRTHRAVLFGSEKITKVKDATGGFVYYGIPVTKSVFYNNPDQVTNEAVSRGTFKGLHTTIKTDREFEKLLKQLYKIGFDICLHTPEQYTTTPSNLKEALDYMQREFKSTTWIDHGYNNGLKNNREDLVCDGLLPQSEYYAAHQWRRHGIKYLWNAYYEENRMNPWCFDNSLIQPYPGFGDALPNRQVTTIVGHDYFHGSLTGIHRMIEPTFLAWSTPSTLEAVTDAEWDFYYSDARLLQLVDNHNVHITHIYPAWVWPGRTFWTYDADSTIIALPGMNRAFERIAALREEHKMLPMTIKTYLDYYNGLLQVVYEIVDAEHIRLINLGGEIKGFTLLCPTPVRFEDNRYYEFRKSGNNYYLWFDLKASDEVILRIIND
jgi:hypothetical protein